MTINRVIPVVDISGARPWIRRLAGSALVLACAMGLWWACCVTSNSDVPRSSGSVPGSAIVEIDRGDVAEIVVEQGLLESSDDDVVRCQVEAFLGLPAGTSVVSGPTRPTAASRGRTANNKGGTPASVSPAAAAVAAALKGKSKSKAPSEANQSSVRSGGTVAVLGMKRGESKSTDGSAAAGSSSTTAAAGSESSTAAGRPAIRSFDYVVEPHVPLRSMLGNQGVVASAAPPPPTILSIVPEGSQVKAGDVVCELDSSAFRDVLQVQRIRFVQAKAWVEQANYLLEANEIALREYAEGILPQDTELVRNYIRIRETERAQASRNLAWSRAAHAKGFRTEAQVEADAAALQRAEFSLRDAECMLKRLIKFTGKRILKARNAKIQAIRADLLSLEATFQLETERLKRIEAMIANCTMRAPRDGIVVYANRVNGWGTVEMQIREGLTVYQSQPIFRLLDPRHLQVKAMINESRVARIRSGQPVLIHLEAFPDRPLWGSVAEIMPISTLTKGPFSDVRNYYATVHIQSGNFDALRTGLSAELEFLVETRHQVPRVPLEATRRFGDRTYAAIPTSATDGTDWEWRPISLGASDTTFAEVLSGLEPGDRVIAHSESLPTPELDAIESHPNSDLALKGHDARTSFAR